MGIFGKEPDTKPAEPPPPVRTSAPPPSEKEKSAPPAAAGPATAARAGTCIIAPKTVVKGEITGDEDIVVEGNVEGQIRISRDLRVGANGVGKATVEAQCIIVSGELIGDCQAAGRVEIQSTGRLTGNIRAPK